MISESNRPRHTYLQERNEDKRAACKTDASVPSQPLRTNMICTIIRQVIQTPLPVCSLLFQQHSYNDLVLVYPSNMNNLNPNNYLMMRCDKRPIPHVGA
jgi:hypothetical protein